ncbi:MAG: HD domain-containing protein, partial [Butyrivibrio sp.]|nr:HD domain-containing protein [Butyrivibrio sp.]
EKSYTLVKKMQIWEHTWFKVYLAVVCVELIVFATWTVIIMINNSKRKEELERLRKELEVKVSEQTEEIRMQQIQTVTALSEAVDAKDRYTSGHSKRVAEYSRRLAMRMGKSAEEQEEIYRAGLLHDVGKIRIPEIVINKPGKLTPEEYELVKVHPVTGYHILKGIPGGGMIAQAARSHHERYDGAGYPNGLRGNDIPEIARIIGVADAYDTMASNRSYRKVLPQEEVRAEIERGKGCQFDPEIADIMLQMIDEDKEYKMRQQSEGERKTVLVVGDERTNIETAEFIMDDEPMHKVIGASETQKVLELLSEGGIDLVLLDESLPDMEGIEALAGIIEAAHAPVVFMTSDKNIETIKRLTELGVDDYLTKPFLPLTLKELVHGILNG